MSLLEKRRPDRGFLPSLRSSFDDLFDFDGFFDEPRLRMPRLANLPATNIREMDKEFIVELAAPGLKKEDFHVDVENNMLEIKVERKSETEEEKEKYTRKEYDYTAFYRSFTLPDFVLTDKIKAEYRNGVLMIHLPKSEKGIKRAVKEISVD
jgi:HSP20 family protein